jgi:hypothetical protein
MSHDSEQPILQQIHELVAEEHELRSTHTGIGLNSAERNRLEAIERELDRCWDLLRHRRAAEEYGADAGAATGAAVEPDAAGEPESERYDPDNDAGI